MNLSALIRPAFSATARREIRGRRQAQEAARHEQQKLLIECPFGINLFEAGIVPENDAPIIRMVKRYNKWLDENKTRFADIELDPIYLSGTGKSWYLNHEAESGKGHISLSSPQQLMNVMEERIATYLRAQANISTSARRQQPKELAA